MWVVVHWVRRTFSTDYGELKKKLFPTRCFVIFSMESHDVHVLNHVLKHVIHVFALLYQADVGS